MSRAAPDPAPVDESSGADGQDGAPAPGGTASALDVTAAMTRLA